MNDRWKRVIILFSILLLGLSPFSPVHAQEDKPGMSLPSLGNRHISSIRAAHPPYNSKPPTSGPHTHNVAKWGVYRQQIPNELQVHNLEDGGVLIQYDCKDCKDLIKKIEKLAWSYLKKGKKGGVSSRYGHLIAAPYAGMDTRIALTAWTRIDKLDHFDEARIKQFIEAYIGVDHHPSGAK